VIYLTAHAEEGTIKKALEKVKQLSGLLPICASCKKIRDDQGYWKQIEVYISEHSDAEFSHGICEECARRIYPKFYEKTRIGNKNGLEYPRPDIEK
jgi:hypothetical protein